MSPLIPVLAGGFLAIAGGACAKLIERHFEKCSLAGALSGEITAIVDLVKRQNFLPGIDDLITKAKSPTPPAPANLRFKIRVERKYFIIYESNAAKIGLLPGAVAANMARFYTITKAIIEDVTDQSYSPATVPEALKRLTELKTLMEELIRIGGEAGIGLKKAGESDAFNNP